MGKSRKRRGILIGNLRDREAERSKVVGGVGDGLGRVEREAEIALGVAPEVIGFAGLLVAFIGKEDGAEFVSGF